MYLCKPCAQRVDDEKSKATLGKIFTEPCKPYSTICMDRSNVKIKNLKNTYILRIVDHFTMHATFIPLEDKNN